MNNMNAFYCCICSMSKRLHLRFSTEVGSILSRIWDGVHLLCKNHKATTSTKWFYAKNDVQPFYLNRKKLFTVLFRFNIFCISQYREPVQLPKNLIYRIETYCTEEKRETNSYWSICSRHLFRKSNKNQQINLTAKQWINI